MYILWLMLKQIGGGEGWVAGPALPAAVAGLRLVELGGSVYSTGGLGGAGQHRPDIWQLVERPEWGDWVWTQVTNTHKSTKEQQS